MIETKVTKVTKNNWPEAISDGLFLPCSICKRHTSIDYRVSDEFWIKLVPEQYRSSVICIECIIKLSKVKNVKIYNALETIQCVGNGETIILHPKQVYIYDK